MASNVLIIGSGGREHALAWKIAQSARIGKLYVATGNGGTRDIAENIAVEATDIIGLARFAEKKFIDLTVVGPDNPLALGVVDAFQRKGLRIFGPTRAAAQIEWSKAFAKRLMRERGIPTAPFRIFRKYDNALEYVRKHGAPVVVKASGLALGKGAYPCKTLVEAEEALTEIILDVLDACVDGKLAELTIEWNSGFAVCVVLASGGYPGEYKKDIPIFGVSEAEKVPGVVVFQAGTTYSNNKLLTSSGRVLGVTAVGETIQEALDLIYEAIHHIKFKGMHYRKDIGRYSTS